MDISRRQQVRTSAQYIGQRIRYGRSLAKVSQETLGAALGVSFQQVQKYENGINRVAACTLVAIAEELKLDIAFFLPAQKTATTVSTLEVAAFRADLASASEAIKASVASMTALGSRLEAAETRLAEVPA